jgi:hypothetical protein
MRRAIVGFGRFWYDFVVGDDWRIAAGVVVLVVIAAVAVSRGDVSATGLAIAVAVLTTLLTAVGTTLAGLRLHRGRRSG